MEQMMDQKIQVVHKRLDAFELRVLDRPALTIDVTTFQTELTSLCAEVVALLDPTDTAPEAATTAEEDDVVMTTLFGHAMPPPDSSCVVGKRHCSDHTYDADEARRLKKKERKQFEVAQMDSILNEERRQQRVREVYVGPSGISSTTDDAPIVGEGTTDGVPSVDPTSSGKLDPPAS
uniref:Integrase core domain containing protein n=1 Tax=Solanum tuberosum TaxID=4113 RepID=M1DRZ0_SOLTU